MGSLNEVPNRDACTDIQMGRNETSEESLDNQSNEQQTDIGRRTMIGISVASIIELMLSGVFSQTARALQHKAIPSVHQLSSADAMTYVRQQLSTNTAAQQLKQEFEKQGYKFLLERAKVFKLANQTLAILPSLIPAKRTDPFHKSVGISICDAGTVAGGAKISHSPRFQVSEFTFYQLSPQGKLESQTITAKALSSKTTSEIVKELGKPMVSANARSAVDSGTGPQARSQDLDKIIELFYKETISDKYASPLYGPGGMRSMLAQISLIQKFSEVNGRFYAQTPGMGLTLCTSTSSNTCTSTSSITIDV